MQKNMYIIIFLWDFISYILSQTRGWGTDTVVIDHIKARALTLVP